MQNLRDKELAMILSNHLFGKLALTSYFAVDKAWNCEYQGQCFCDDENCEMTGAYVDTSIGNYPDSRSVYIFNFEVFIQSHIMQKKNFKYV